MPRRHRNEADDPAEIGDEASVCVIEPLDVLSDRHYFTQPLKRTMSKDIARIPSERTIRYRGDQLVLIEHDPHGFGPGAFNPQPQVESAFVRLEPHDRPPVDVLDEAVFAEIVRRAFAQRRKTVRNALREVLDAGEIASAGVDPGARAEVLAVGEFAALANYVANRQTGPAS